MAKKEAEKPKPVVSKLIEQLNTALMVGTPLIGIETPDPFATVESIKDVVKEQAKLIKWDTSVGFTPINESGRIALTRLIGRDDATKYEKPDEAMKALVNLEENSVCFVMNMHNLIKDPAGASISIVQSIANVRDRFKAKNAALVGLGPELKLPPELANDFIVFDEPFPGDEERAAIIDTLISDAEKSDEIKFEAPDEKTRTAAIDATRGMHAFMVGQQTAIACQSGKLDIDFLRVRRRKVIEMVPGLKIHQGKITFKQLGGIDFLAEHNTRLMESGEFGCVVLFDEYEKMMGGASKGDGNVSTEMKAMLLSWTEEKEVGMQMLTGPGGTGKTAAGIATAAAGGFDLIAASIPEMKDQYVGNSTRNMRIFLKTVEAQCGEGKKPMIICTTNSMSVFAPEDLRRFIHGIYFVDVPSKAAQETIWPLYDDGTMGERPDTIGWTGAEIRNVCKKAKLMKISLKEAAKYIVPVTLSAGAKLKAMREEADGKYLAASYEGYYRGIVEEVTEKTTSRKFGKGLLN